MKTINHECYVSLEVAELLKEAGFDWECKYCYNTDGWCTTEMISFSEDGRNYNHWINPKGEVNNWAVSVPTLSVAQRWLREVKNWHIFVEFDNSTYQCRIDEYEHIYYIKHREWLDDNKFREFSTYEQALEAGIKKALELILEKGE